MDRYWLSKSLVDPSQPYIYATAHQFGKCITIKWTLCWPTFAHTVNSNGMRFGQRILWVTKHFVLQWGHWKRENLHHAWKLQ